MKRFARPALALFVPIVLVGPSPTPDLKQLGAILAGAPDSSWTEEHVSSDTLEGPFGATFYVNAEWSDQSDRDKIKAELVADGFIGGYGRTFDKAAPEAYIIEDVKAFPDATRAMANYQWAQAYFHDPSDTANNVATPAIPNSFGERYVNDPWHGIDIYFTKANYVYTVSVGGKTDYLPDVATAQASKVFAQAPSDDIFKSNAGGTGASSLPAALVVGGGAAFVILAVVVVAVALIAATRRRRPPAGAPQAMLSPDGNYWWDGTSWQPVTRR